LNAWYGIANDLVNFLEHGAGGFRPDRQLRKNVCRRVKFSQSWLAVKPKMKMAYAKK
jgi:hypothetical protein